jgi:hypothetical protein
LQFEGIFASLGLPKERRGWLKSLSISLFLREKFPLAANYRPLRKELFIIIPSSTMEKFYFHPSTS